MCFIFGTSLRPPGFNSPSRPIGHPGLLSPMTTRDSVLPMQIQPVDSRGPPPTTELACKSESSEKTFTFCVASSCVGTATCEGCWSDFGLMRKVKCMSYNIQGQQNFCQSIDGIKFLCSGKCVARTACSNCEYDNVQKSKAFIPPWPEARPIVQFDRWTVSAEASQHRNSRSLMIALLILMKIAVV